MNQDRPPVVFIHDAFLHASSWAPWVELFERRDYLASAPTWPGEASTVADARLADIGYDIGLEDVVRHYGVLISHHNDVPVLIGSGVGAAIVDRLMQLGFARAAISLATAHLDVARPAALTRIGGRVELTFEQFVELYDPDAVQAQTLFDQWVVPASASVLDDASSDDRPRESDASLVLAIAGRSRATTVDTGWAAVAEQCLTWLDTQHL